VTRKGVEGPGDA